VHAYTAQALRWIILAAAVLVVAYVAWNRRRVRRTT
jgi:lipopolysaccharide export system protein LptC